MDKVLSVRVDGTVILRIGVLAKQLHTSKKKTIENAVGMYAARIDEEQESDLLEQTSGAWRRDEPAGQLVGKARDAFRTSMEKRRR